MIVTLDKNLENYVTEQVLTGRYGSAAEVIEAALRLKIEEDEAAYFRERIRISEEDVKDGRVVRADDAFFDSLRERIWAKGVADSK